MANDGSGNTGVVAVLVIFIIVLALGFFAWQGGWFGGGDGELDVNIEADAPDVDRPQINIPAPQAPASNNPPAEAPASE